MATSAPTTIVTPEPDTPARGSRRRHRRPLALGLAAAAVVAVVVAAATLAPDGPGPRPDPVAALDAAAVATGDITSLRVDGTYTSSEGTSTVDEKIHGPDYDLRISNPDGVVERTVVIGDTMWDAGDSPDPIKITPDMVHVPFPKASHAVLEAALTGAEVTDLGDEQVAGVKAAHYGIDLSPEGVKALSQLDGTVTGPFELEDSNDVTDLDVWVADDLIRRIDLEINQKWGPNGTPDVLKVHLEFLDIGKPVTVTPPG